MAYTAPATWQHGDYPTAPPFNAYKDSIDAVHAQTGDAQVNVAVCRRGQTVQGFYIVHKQPWLIYLIQSPDTHGTIEDPAGVGDDVSLEVTQEWESYDLSSIDWLYPGKTYQIQGVSSCFEDVTSL